MDIQELDKELSRALNKLNKNLNYYDQVIEDTTKLQNEYIRKAETMDKLIKTSNAEVLKIIKKGDEVNKLKEEINNRIKEISNSINVKERDIKNLSNDIEDINRKADELDEMIVAEEQDYKQLTTLLKSKNDEFIKLIQSNIEDVNNKANKIDEVIAQKEQEYDKSILLLKDKNNGLIVDLENDINNIYIKSDQLDQIIIDKELDYKKLITSLRNENDKFKEELDSTITNKADLYNELMLVLRSSNNNFIEKLENNIKEFNALKKEYDEIQQAFQVNRESIEKSKEIVQSVLNQDTKEIASIIEKRGQIIQECDIAVKNVELIMLEIKDFKEIISKSINTTMENQEKKMRESCTKQLEDINHIKDEYNKKIKIASATAILGVILGIIGIIF